MAILLRGMAISVMTADLSWNGHFHSLVCEMIRLTSSPPLIRYDCQNR